MISFKEFLLEQTMGININDDSAPWTDMILSGKKTIETRNKPTLNAYIGKRVGLIRTGKKRRATLVGYATIGTPIKYTSPEEFNKDKLKHRVAPDNILYNGGVKYGYPLINVERCEPKEIFTRGIVSRKLDEQIEVPICVGTRGTEIIIVYPNSDTRYLYDLGLEYEANRYFRLCNKFGAGRYINKIKQYPMRTL